MSRAAPPRPRGLQVYQAKPNRHTPTLYWKGHWSEGHPVRKRTKWLGKVSEMTEEQALQELAESLGVDLAADKLEVIQSDEQLLAKYLAECSGTGLSDFFLNRLDRDNHLKKRLVELIDELVKNAGWLELARIIREHGAALRGERETAEPKIARAKQVLPALPEPKG